MLVTRVIGACPKCGTNNAFGNVTVGERHLQRGCISCAYKESIPLPPIRKKIIYLDQFFFSGAFRGGDARFLAAAKRIRELTEKQLLVAPFSTLHEDETYQWAGYNGQDNAALMEFIKGASRGHTFEAQYDVERVQLLRAYEAYLVHGPTEYQVNELDALKRNVHTWDDYFFVDVGRYRKDVEQVRALKRQAVNQLIDAFEVWRTSTATFEEDVSREISVAAQSYITAYFTYLQRILSGDLAAHLDSPVISLVIQSMLSMQPAKASSRDDMENLFKFFVSDHFKNAPYQWLSVRIFAVLKDMVRRGAYTNRENALRKLGGFFYDVSHIATYAPYCDAFIMDQPMAALVADPRVSLEKRYDVKVFSLNNWEQLFEWLDGVEQGADSQHQQAVEAIWGNLPLSIRSV